MLSCKIPPDSLELGFETLKLECRKGRNRRVHIQIKANTHVLPTSTVSELQMMVPVGTKPTTESLYYAIQGAWFGHRALSVSGIVLAAVVPSGGKQQVFSPLR